jgi:signal transduction histidine kinase
MKLSYRVLSLVGFAPMAHRPPLRRRFWLYCAAAYLTPVIVEVAIPRSPGLYDELVWLVTLAPAFLLSLHYGLKGAMAGLVMGTALFLTVQAVVAVNFTPDDLRVVVPIYLSYGILAVSVGWLSEQLHEYYQQALKGARLAAIGQVAVTIRHEVNNALTSIVAEATLLADDKDAQLTTDQRTGLKTIQDAAMKIAGDIRKLTVLEDAPVADYLPGIKMVDLRAAPASG